MGKFISNIVAGFAALLSVPSLLFMITWNSLPGTNFYPLKIVLEDIVLDITLKTPLASQLSVKYTQRRYSEATRLLFQKGSTLGYSLLVQETKESKNIIVGKNDSEKAGDLVEKIEEYQENIKEKQQAIQSGGIIIPVASTYNTTFEASPVPQVPDQTSQIPESTPLVATQATSSEEVIEDLEKANEDFEAIKNEIEIQLPESASDNAEDV